MKNNVLWRCPDCHRQFVNVHQWHSCYSSTVDNFLERKDKRGVEIYKKFEKMVKKLGPIKVNALKTRISFQTRMNAISVDKISKEGIDVHLVLGRRLKNPRFTKVETYSPRNHVHFFKITNEKELDNEILSWLKEAYEAANQKHFKLPL